MQRYLSVLFVIILLSRSLFSQDRIKFENISVVDGLSNPSIQSILQDSEGFMWFGTADGLNKYDGLNFNVYREESGNPNSLKGNLILDIYEDSDKKIWIATDVGLNIYNRNTDSFKLYQMDSSDSRPFYNGVVSVYEDTNDLLWVAKAYDGLTFFDRDSLKFKVFEIDTVEKSTGLFAIWDIMEDSNGELWYTKGQNFNNASRLYKLNKEKTREIYIEELVELNERQNNFSGRFYKDNNENLWFQTFGGYSISYNPSNKEFKFYDLGENIIIYSTARDYEGNIWNATLGSGLLKYDLEKNEIFTYTTNILDENSVSSINNTIIFIDDAGIFWLGSADKGLDKFDPFREPFELYTITEGEGANKENNIITAFSNSLIDSDHVWVGTNKGLFIFNLTDRSITAANEIYPIKLPEQLLVSSLIEDTKGVLWIGSDRGIYQFNIASKKTENLKSDPNNRKTISNDIIRSIIEDKNGNIWIATLSGLNKYSYSENSIKRYNFIDTSYTAEVWDVFEKLYESNKKIATLTKIKSNKDTSATFRITESKDVLIVSIGEIFTLPNGALWDYGWVENSDGEIIWMMDSLNNMHAGGAPKNRISADLISLNMGTYKLRYKTDDSHSYSEWNASPPLNPEFWGIEIYEITKEQNAFLKEKINETEVGNSISDPNIRSLYADTKGRIWIGTNNSGFSVYNPDEGVFKRYNYSTNSVSGFTSSRVNGFLEDDIGNIWLATFGGLQKFNAESETFDIYDVKKGIPTNYLMRLLKDDNGNIWFSSQKGLTQFDPKQNDGSISFVNFDIKDGLQAYQFSSNGALKLSDGRLIFGGLKGFNLFFPGNINNNPPNVVITKLFLSNKEVTAGSPDSPIEKAISQVKEINLAHNQNDLSFEYKALHYARPDKNQYAHFFEGFDKNWIYDNRPFATYTNLDPGKYVFRVKASNSDGVWNLEDTSIKVIISSPWWATGWAYISYVLAGGLLFFTFNRAQKRRIIKEEREKQKILSAELRAKAAEAESRAVKAENERKTRELEEARNLQLSMLPKTLPDLPNLDIAVFMKTATEVGGDYYDFHVSLDGTLTAVIGDATGHGLNAGTIVTITKSLFNSHGANDDILFTFEEISKVLKDMKFKYLSMCLQILKIKNNSLMISSAGMPPALIYRKNDNSVEELLLKGMPLGAPASFPYEVRSTELYKGDTILLMSDGFPELMNKDKKILGYDTAQQKFKEVADKDPEEIINHLKEEGSNYVNHKDPNDDVTFVVVKVK